MLGYGVKETTATTGTGTLTLSAVTNFPRFSQAFAVGDLVFYSLLSSAGEPIESGIGTVGASNTLARTRPMTTFSGGTYDNSSPSAVSLSGTTTVIGAALPASNVVCRPNIDSVSSGVFRSLPSAHHVQQYNNTKSFYTNRCWYVPFLIETMVVINGLSFRSTAGGSSGKVRMGLYRCGADGYIGDLIEQTGDITDITTTGQKSGSIGPYLLAPGWYFVAMCTNQTVTGTTIVACASGSNSCIVQTPFGMNSSLDPIGMRYQTLSSGWSALPTTPSATTTAETFGVGYMPMAFMDLA